MSIRFYHYNQASAPVLTGQANTLISLLDAILVNGYGSQAAAGWTKPYSESGKAVYRSVTSGIKKSFYLRVVDNGDTNRSALWSIFSGMSNIDTGSNGVPNLFFGAKDFYIRKSSTSDATTRAWWAIASDSMILLTIGASSSSSDYATAFSAAAMENMFCGQYVPIMRTELPFFAIGRLNTTIGTGSLGVLGSVQGGPVTGSYVMKSFYSGDRPNAMRMRALYARGTSTPAASTKFLNEHNTLRFSPLYIFENETGSDTSAAVSGFPSGILPFISLTNTASTPTTWRLNAAAQVLSNSFEGEGALAGKTYMMHALSSGASLYTFLIQTSGEYL